MTSVTELAENHGVNSTCSRQSAAFRNVRLEVRSAFAVAVLVVTMCALAESRQPAEASPAIDLSPAEQFPISWQVLRSSGRIFSGTVLRVEHHDSDSSSSLATTRIVFRVNEAIRNVRRGQTVAISEWAGLWQSGERYHTGERVLLFLYPPSRLGLTSPVGNRAGRFSVSRAGSVTLKAPIGKPPRSIPLRSAVAAIRQAEKERMR